MTTDFDSPWKAALETDFESFMAFCFPRVHADKLVNVHLKDGRETRLLIHIEVQGHPDGTFEERMYIYNHRIFDRYRVEVVSLAVLTDESAVRHATEYRRERFGCVLSFRFPTVNVMAFEKNWDRLEKDPNPFAMVVMAHIKARSVKEGVERKRWKVHLVRLLLERGYDKNDILELFRFIDWLLILPADLEIEFRDDVIDIMEEKKMPYVTSIERLARKEGAKSVLKKNVKKGVQRGIEKGSRESRREMLAELLKSRFQEIPEDVSVDISLVQDIQNLKALFQKALTCEKLNDFRQTLFDLKAGRHSP